MAKQMEQLRLEELFDLSQTIAADALKQYDYPWEVLADIHELILQIGGTLPLDLYDQVGDDVWIAKSATVFDSAYIKGPCIIGERSQVRQCAFIRGDAIVGDDCVVGNSVELKNVILFNQCQVPHFNYVGDSILGCHAHMGAGSITSNVKADNSDVVIKGNEQLETGRRKVGAILGDHVEVGCNAVLNPGTIVGQRSMIYPLTCVRGVIPSDTIVKNDASQIEKQ